MSEATPISIRPGRASDVAACAAIKNHWIDSTAWMPRIHPADDLERHYRETVFALREVWVAGDPPQGFIAVDTEEGEVTSLFVGPKSRGIGKALLDRAKVGRQALELWTFIANESARRFYAREGFAEVARTEGDNEESLADLRLRWERAA